MDLSVEYNRNLADPRATRIAAHFKNAQRRTALVAHGTPQNIATVEAQAQDLVHMTSDALAMLPGLEIAEGQPGFAILLAQMQQLNANMNQMNEQLTERIDGLSRTIIFAMNTNAFILTEGCLIPFQNANNIIPQNFPRSTSEFTRMTGPQLVALLQAYNVDNIPHALVARRARAKLLLTTGH